VIRNVDGPTGRAVGAGGGGGSALPSFVGSEADRGSADRTGRFQSLFGGRPSLNGLESFLSERCLCNGLSRHYPHLSEAGGGSSGQRGAGSLVPADVDCLWVRPGGLGLDGAGGAGAVLRCVSPVLACLLACLLLGRLQMVSAAASAAASSASSLSSLSSSVSLLSGWLQHRLQSGSCRRMRVGFPRSIEVRCRACGPSAAIPRSFSNANIGRSGDLIYSYPP
jgi:hypothetical protein